MRTAEAFPNTKEFPLRNKVASFVTVATTFVWYFYAFFILTEILRKAGLTFPDVSAAWVLNFLGAAISALIGASITGKTKNRFNFLLLWMLAGVLASSVPILMDTQIKLNVFLVAFIFGVSFGFGMPTALACFVDSTAVEHRALFSGIIFLAVGSGTFALGMIETAGIPSKLVVLAALRGIGFAFLFFTRPTEDLKKSESPSYTAILGQRSFLLYFVPWLMFCLVTQTSTPILMNFFGEGFINTYILIEGILVGIFAVVGGFFCDRVGRKRVSILGFVMLGIGYATLGIFPQDMLSWYFYTIVDGLAWGVFYTVFFTTLWGELTPELPSEKYYALGGLPYLFSSFLRFVLGSDIANVIPMYAIFSLASFFLFLSVLPLMYAPETLPERKIKERELKIYLEQAKKLKKKLEK